MDGARAGIIVVGDELIRGETAEKNRDFISRNLVELGVEPLVHMVVRDNVFEISDAIRHVSSSCQVVIVTGGLGPTIDDVTREAAANARGVPLDFHQELADSVRSFFDKLDREVAEVNLRQAYIPRGATVIPATRGTAPGFLFSDEPFLYVLPGVPLEMRQMFEHAVAPHIRDSLGSVPVSDTSTLLVFGVGESDVGQALKDRTGSEDVRYAFLVDSGIIKVKITAMGSEPASRRGLLDEEVAAARAILGPLVFGEGDMTLEEVVGDLLRERGMGIATAESCTAGMIASRIANVPGSSEYLRGGVVTYSPIAKKDVLGLPSQLLEKGTVNRIVALEMAARVKELFSSEIGIGLTCVAGPSAGGETRPVGTVCLGLATPDGNGAFEVKLPGDRNFVRSIAATGALNMVRLYLLGELNLAPVDTPFE